MGKTPDPSEFIEVLAPALRSAASIARSLEGRVANRPKAGEATPVKAALTIADHAAQEALLAPLQERFSGVRLEAEEDTPGTAGFAREGDSLVVVDPIDGTLRFYLEGLGPYAVMVGLAVRDVYQAALVALPREELYLDAVRGVGGRVAAGAAGLRRAQAVRSGYRVLVSHDLPGAAVEVLLGAGFAVEPASGGAIAVAPLLPGVRAGLRLVQGASDSISTRGRIGALIAAEADALVWGEDGRPFPEDIRAPARALLVAAHEDDLTVLCEAVAAADRDPG